MLVYRSVSLVCPIMLYLIYWDGHLIYVYTGWMLNSSATSSHGLVDTLEWPGLSHAVFSLCAGPPELCTRGPGETGCKGASLWKEPCDGSKSQLKWQPIVAKFVTSLLVRRRPVAMECGCFCFVFVFTTFFNWTLMLPIIEDQFIFNEVPWRRQNSGQWRLPWM